MTNEEAPRTSGVDKNLLSLRHGSWGGAWRRRDAVAASVPMVAGAVLSLFAYLSEVNEGCFREQQAFEWRAARLSSAMESAFSVPLEVLHSVPALFHASGSVERREFDRFTRAALSRAPDIYAIEWFPRVPASEREGVVARARREGLGEFEFREVGAGGRMVPTGLRSEYLPLFFMAPPNSTALGLDLTAHPDRLAPAARARDVGHAVASPRLRLVEDPDDVHSLAFFDPMYDTPIAPDTVAARRAGFRGVAAVVFRIAPLIRRVIGPGELGQIRVALLDEGAPEDLRVLFESHPGFGASMGSGKGLPEQPQGWDTSVVARLPEQLMWSRRFRVADRPWRVLMTTGLEPPWRADLVTLLGGLGLSLLVALAVFGMRVIGRMRKQVQAALRLGQYTITGELGRGGMGVVYEAQHAMLRRRTALKLLNSSADETRLRRFEREAQLTSLLTHPNTIAVYDYGSTPDGLFYYAMEFIEGVTFEALVRSVGPLPPARVVHLLAQICGALQEAHEVGLVHRDIKPANLMVTSRGGIPDFVKVLDFGLVKEIRVIGDGGESLTQSRALIGTPHYMCPEGIVSGEVDSRGDLYSLGAVAYFLLTGTEVFPSTTILGVCTGHIRSPPEPPSARLGRPLPADLEALVLRCLAKEPSTRPASALALREALLSCRLEDSWDEREAHEWWRQHGAHCCRQGHKTPAASASTVEQTVIVDYRDRVDWRGEHGSGEVMVPSARGGNQGGRRG